MLAKIWIKNFALIQELRVDFQTGYTVITGETGSGKSILLGALNLILGERADYSLIGPDSDKTFVEAEFDLQSLNLQPWFEHNDIDYEPSTIVRREINKNGRSRAFINDTPVSLPQIKQLTENLVNIHSQHHTLALRDKNFHLELLDILSGLESKVEEYASEFSIYKKLQKTLENKIALFDKLDQERDYIAFQLEEMESLSLEQTQFSVLEEELNRQENMESLTDSLATIGSILDADNSVVDQLADLHKQLERSGLTDMKVAELAKRIDSTLLELRDISSESTNYLERLEKDPAKVLELTTKLDTYNRILSKHKCNSQEELIALKNAWDEQMQTALDGQELIEKLTIELENQRTKVKVLADSLHTERTKFAPKVGKQITALLDELKMPNTQLEFNLTKSESMNAKGNTGAFMLFSSNAGIPLQAMDKIASGGELSRLMLSIQCLISEMKALPSIIFDEIDTGVSGEVAQKIGQLLRRMGENCQLIAISHLPQVAGKAMLHIKVEKLELNGRVQSRLVVLNQEERINEIARLMSGETINSAALANAQNLMQE